MFNSVDKAKNLAEMYSAYISVLNGALYAFADNKKITSKKEFNRFKLQMTETANRSYSETIKAVKATTNQIITESRSRAYYDANINIKSEINTDIDLNNLELVIKQHFINALKIALRMAKKIRGQIINLMSKGASQDTARIKVREGAKNQILSVRTVYKDGRRTRSQWAVYLRLTSFLTQLEHTHYIRQAEELGFTNFTIEQSGHIRDGKKFSIDKLPVKDLHPQSRAMIKLLRENHVHTS